MEETEAGQNAPSCDLPGAQTPQAAAPDNQGQDDRGQGALIYGKQGCPHTLRARQAMPLARFIDVLADPRALEEMLRFTGGARRVPVIKRGRAVEIGFRRGS